MSFDAKRVITRAVLSTTLALSGAAAAQAGSMDKGVQRCLFRQTGFGGSPGNPSYPTGEFNLYETTFVQTGQSNPESGLPSAPVMRTQNILLLDAAGNPIKCDPKR